MKNTVGIVVVTHNRFSLLKEVIDSIRNQTYSNFQIIVVNNGSTDETANWLATQGDIITITQGNLGGAGGFHYGMKYVVENDYDYCWIMDDDVVCSHNALEELMNAYNAKQDIGFVCSKVVGLDGTAMNTPIVDDRVGVNGYMTYHDLLDHQMIKVRHATFVSVLFATSTIVKFGLPYKEYFIWGDDTEYTTRVSSCCDSYMTSKSVVVHKRILQRSISFDAETDENRIRMFFYYFRNNWFNKIKDKSLLFKVFFCLKCYGRCVKYLFKGNLKQTRILFSATNSLISFNPQIVFPSK